MMRSTLAVAVLALCVSSAGCGCCNWLRRPAVAAYPAPTYAAPACAPACPAPAPVCDPCTTAPVNYGTPVPVAPYTPPPQW